MPDWQHRPERAGATYGTGEQVHHSVREWLARANAVLDVKRQREPAVRR